MLTTQCQNAQHIRAWGICQQLWERYKSKQCTNCSRSNQRTIPYDSQTVQYGEFNVRDNLTWWQFNVAKLRRHDNLAQRDEGAACCTVIGMFWWPQIINNACGHWTGYVSPRHLRLATEVRFARFGKVRKWSNSEKD